METASASEASYKSNPTTTENKPGNPSDTFIPGSYDYSPVGTSNILTITSIVENKNKAARNQTVVTLRRFPESLLGIVGKDAITMAEKQMLIAVCENNSKQAA